MIHISYTPEKKDKFILVTNNSLNDVVNIPTGTNPVKCKNRAGYWKIKSKENEIHLTTKRKAKKA